METTAKFGRREALMVPVGLFFATSMVGCGIVGNSPASDAVSKALTFGSAISQGVKDLLAGVPQLGSLIGGGNLSKVQTWAGAIETAVGQLAGLGSGADATSIVAALISAAEGILSVVGVVLPPPFDLILPAVSALLPTLAKLFGLAGVSLGASRRIESLMTTEQALATLANVHAVVVR